MHTIIPSNMERKQPHLSTSHTWRTRTALADGLQHCDEGESHCRSSPIFAKRGRYFPSASAELQIEIMIVNAM